MRQRQLAHAGLVVLLLACSLDQAPEDGAETGGNTSTSGGAANTGGSATTGGSGVGGASNSGGSPTSSGGSGTSAGGSATNAGSSGTTPGGSSAGFGGAAAGSGGSSAGAGGVAGNAGESSAGVGGAAAGSGGSSAGAGSGNAGGSAGSGGSGGQVDTPVTVALFGDNVNANGPLQTTVQDLSFSGGGHILVRPTTLTSEPNTKHPVAIWGPGGGTPPRDYLQLLTRMASQGFVIVGIRESKGDAELMTAAIDWLEDEDENPSSPMHDRLMLGRVGVFGHSMGGLSSEAIAQKDKRVSTALLDNSGSFEHNALVNVTIPVGIIYGETGQEAPNAEGDFNNAGNKGPVWLGMMKGGGHGSGPWDGAAANVAWMRWHLGGENFRKDEFLTNGGDYNGTGVWQSKHKNWDGWKNWNE